MSVLSNVDVEEIISSDKGILILNRKDDKKDKNLTGPGYDLRIGFICDDDTGECPIIDGEEKSFFRKYF